MAMLAEHAQQRGLQQMCGRMSAADGGAALRIDHDLAGFAQLDRAAHNAAVVHEFAALVLLHVRDLEHAVRAGDRAVVGDLTAHLGVHRRPVEHHDSLDACGDLTAGLVLRHDGEHGALGLVFVIADELRLGNILTEVDAGPAEVAEGLACLSCADLLLLHELLEGFEVDLHALLARHLDRQVDREAVGVIELEGICTGENGFVVFLMLRQHLGENAHAAVDRAGKVLLLYADDAGDIGGALAQVGIVALVLVDDRLNNITQERMVHAEQLAVAGSAAEQAAQHIAAALIRGQHAVGDHKDGCTDVVRDDAQRDILLMAHAIVRAGDLRDLVGDVHDGVDIEQGVNVLAGNGKTLEAHAGVDVLLDEVGIVAVAVVVKLGEDVVPDLHIAVAVAADGAAGLAAAILLAAVIIDLGAGAARAGAMLPEVVLLAEAENAVGRDADLLVPDLERLVVVLIDGRIQAVLLEAADLRQEFPAPGNCLMLEIVAE